MKIRNGFISNSSSSSFIINKKSLDSDFDYKKLEKDILKEVKDFDSEWYEFTSEDVLFLDINLKNEKEQIEIYSDTVCWSKPGIKKLLHKEDFVIMSNGDNAIPYDFINFLEKYFEVNKIPFKYVYHG